MNTAVALFFAEEIITMLFATAVAFLIVKPPSSNRKLISVAYPLNPKVFAKISSVKLVYRSGKTVRPRFEAIKMSGRIRRSAGLTKSHLQQYLEDLPRIQRHDEGPFQERIRAVAAGGVESPQGAFCCKIS